MPRPTDWNKVSAIVIMLPVLGAIMVFGVRLWSLPDQVSKLDDRVTKIEERLTKCESDVRVMRVILNIGRGAIDGGTNIIHLVNRPDRENYNN